MSKLVDIVCHANGFLENGHFIPREICLASVDLFSRYEDFTVSRCPLGVFDLSETLINEFKSYSFNHLPLNYDGGEVYENYAPRRVRSIYKKLGEGTVGVIGQEQFDFFRHVCKLPSVVDLQNYVPRFQDLIDDLYSFLDFIDFDINSYLPSLHENVHKLNDTRFCSIKIAWYVARYVQLQLYVREKDYKCFSNTDEIDNLCILQLQLLNFKEEEIDVQGPEWYYRYFDHFDLDQIFKDSVNKGLLL